MHGQTAVFIAAGVSATLFCLLGTMWFGPAAALLNLLTPLPAVYLSLRSGLRSGAIVVGITSAVLLLLTSPYTLATYLVLFGIGPLLLSFGLLVRIPWDRAAFLAASGSLVFAMLVLMLVTLTGPYRVPSMIDQLVQVEADQALQIYRQAGFNEHQLLEISQVIERLAVFVKTSFIGILAAVLLVIQAVTLVLLQPLTKKHFHFAGSPFTQWRLPAKLIWLLIISGFTAFLTLPGISWIGQNLLLILLPLYFLQGMAVISSFLQRRPYPVAIKGLIYLLLLVLSPLPMIVTSIGIFDLWIDFRKNRQEKLS